MRILLGMGLILAEPKLRTVRNRVREEMDDLRDKASQGCEDVSGQFMRGARAIRGQSHSQLTNALKFAAGVSVGLATGLLLAPSSGEDMRRSMARKIQDLRSGMRQRYVEAAGD